MDSRAVGAVKLRQAHRHSLAPGAIRSRQGFGRHHCGLKVVQICRRHLLVLFQFLKMP